MRRLIGGTAYILLGLGIGAASAYFLIERSGAVPFADDSAWTSRAMSPGTGESYLIRAHYMLGGRLPPPPGQLVELNAETDDDGEPLRSRCRYRLASQGGLPVWWSISVAAPGSIAGSRQSALDSSSALRSANGDVLIEAAAQPQPGNWLRLPPSTRFALLFTTLPRPQAILSKAPFVIRKVACR